MRAVSGIATDDAGEQATDEFPLGFDVLDAFERAAEQTPDDDFEADGVQENLRGVANPPSPVIAFGANAKRDALTAYSRRVLQDIMQAAGVNRVVISSTSRSPSEQARVMFNNLEQYGVEHQKRLYGAGGDQVIEVYRKAKRAGKDKTEIRALMTQEIVRIGATRVSRHASDPNVLNVFDVAPNSITRKAAFEKAVRADRRVSKFLKPPADPGYHLEIPQPT
jgi:hypothetical protein